MKLLTRVAVRGGCVLDRLGARGCRRQLRRQRLTLAFQSLDLVLRPAESRCQLRALRGLGFELAIDARRFGAQRFERTPKLFQLAIRRALGATLFFEGFLRLLPRRLNLRQLRAGTLDILLFFANLALETLDLRSRLFQRRGKLLGPTRLRGDLLTGRRDRLLRLRRDARRRRFRLRRRERRQPLDQCRDFALGFRRAGGAERRFGGARRLFERFAQAFELVASLLGPARQQPADERGSFGRGVIAEFHARSEETEDRAAPLQFSRPGLTVGPIEARARAFKDLRSRTPKADPGVRSHR